MKECQKKKREELEKIWKAEKGGITKSFSKLLSKMVILAENSNRKELALYTDEHKQYVTAWIKHKELKKLKGTIECTHVQINSRLPRTVHNPLFSVNYMDREMRKDLPEHVRQSTRFGRNVSDCNNRLILYQLWHNTEKKYRINLPAGEFISHLEMAGYDPDEWQIELDTIYTERRFISHVENMDDTGIDIWFRRIETPLKENPEYVPAFAAA